MHIWPLVGVCGGGAGGAGGSVLGIQEYEYCAPWSGGPVLSTAPYITQGTCRVGNGDMQPEGFVVVAVEGGGGQGRGGVGGNEIPTLWTDSSKDAWHSVL